jgi:hypothetical protein
VGFSEVSVVEVREVLRGWLEGVGVTGVRPVRPNGHGASWETLLGCEPTGLRS